MRRQAPSLPISLKQLKHFAAATVAITVLLALFVGGEDASVAAKVQATAAKNDLVAAEQKKLGTKRIATSLKVRNSNTGGFGEDGGGDFGGGGGGGGGGGSAVRSGMPVAQGQGPAFLPPTNLAIKPGGTIKRKGPAKSGKPGDQADADGGFAPDSGSGGGKQPDTSKLGAAIEASRMRSGSADRNGD